MRRTQQDRCSYSAVSVTDLVTDSQKLGSPLGRACEASKLLRCRGCVSAASTSAQRRRVDESSSVYAMHSERRSSGGSSTAAATGSDQVGGGQIVGLPNAALQRDGHYLNI